MKTQIISSLKALMNSLVLVAILITALTSCATIDGAGQDIELSLIHISEPTRPY